MSRTTLPHFVVTRLGIGIQSEEWFRSALGLFEAVTFPSLCAQSCPDIASLIIVNFSLIGEALRRDLALSRR
jgi:hypothetical protein